MTSTVSGGCRDLGWEFRVHAARLKPELRTRGAITVPIWVIRLHADSPRQVALK